MNVDAKLAELGLRLPMAPEPVAAYVPTVEAAGLIFVAGQLPFVDGELKLTGKVGREVTVESATKAARVACLNALAAVKAALGGDWSRFGRVVRVGVFVASADDFTGQSQVANGASKLLGEVFGDAGRHVRAAVGVNVLPLDAPVEVEMVVEVTSNGARD